jgi:hypothetical protein
MNSTWRCGVHACAAALCGSASAAAMHAGSKDLGTFRSFIDFDSLFA